MFSLIPLFQMAFMMKPMKVKCGFPDLFLGERTGMSREPTGLWTEALRHLVCAYIMQVATENKQSAKKCYEIQDLKIAGNSL